MSNLIKDSFKSSWIMTYLWILNNPLMTYFLVFFICLKIPVLNFPLYWDEPAYNDLKLMSWDGLKYFFPWNTDDLGLNSHPVGLQFLLYWFYQFFGYNLISMHLLALFLSVIALCCYYELTKEFLGKSGATLLSIFIGTSPIFFSQSTQFLPDIPTISVSVLAFLLFRKKKYITFSFVALLAGMMSESALGFSGALIVISCYQLFKKNIEVKHFLLSFLPVISLIYFFIKKKIIEGAYINHPAIIDRENMVNFKWWEINDENLNTLKFMNEFFLHNSANMLLVLAALGLIFSLIRFKKYINEVVIYFFLSSVAYYLFFFIYGDYHPRNIFPVFNFVFFFYVITIKEIGKHFKPVKILASISVIMALISYWFKPFHTGDAIYRTYVDETILCKRMFNYIEKNNDPGPFYATFPIAYFFKDVGSGYVDAPLRINPYYYPHYNNISGLNRSKKVALTNIENKHNLEFLTKYLRENHFQLEKEFTVGGTKGWIYSRPD